MLQHNADAPLIICSDNCNSRADLARATLKYIVSIYSKSMMDASILQVLDEDDLLIIAAILHKRKNAQYAEKIGSRNGRDIEI